MNFLRIYSKRFTTNYKINNFSNITKEIKFSKPKLNTTPFEDKLHQVKLIITHLNITNITLIKI